MQLYNLQFLPEVTKRYKMTSYLNSFYLH